MSNQSDGRPMESNMTQVKSRWVGPEGGKILVGETVNAINLVFDGTDYPVTR